MIPSLHDNFLVSYEVDCERREVKLRARRADWAEEPLTRLIEFTGVQGYHFQNDAFGNVACSLEEIPLDIFFSEHGSEIVESYRLACAPSPWAGDMNSAQQKLADIDIKAFVLSSSYGLSGWLLAKTFEVREVIPAAAK